MKLSLNKKNIKTLTNDKTLLPQEATMLIAGAGKHSGPTLCTAIGLNAVNSRPSNCTANTHN
ncbi:MULTISPECIES: hypothetical protein [unclassified Pseudoalteromonas]|uniref:hypothetical protein n=1 Tax=unclassified Pseudoalteromonas TaxID=194690 RepID=UPI001B39F1AA|nr:MULTISPECIES: hypothetical protein [unclassified Pseudoalteromonas]MBQ4844704.1 hypothetical protein [Pseudoalteromonas sp. MMG005]MBQ4850899.1 hypothetical protein [Pseudoalteromonas sp. MMG012]